MRRLPSGAYVHEIRRKRLGRWSFSLSENTREAQRQRAALNALADAGEVAVLDRVVSHDLSVEDVARALAPGGAGIESLRPHAPSFESVTFERAAHALRLELATSPRNTRRIAEVVLRQLFDAFGASTPIATVSFDAAQRWLRKPRWSIATQEQKRSYATRLWALAIRLERDAARAHSATPLLVDNPWPEIKPPREAAREARFLDLADTHALLDVLERAGRLRDAAFLACGFLGTMRISEAAALRWRDIDFDEGTIQIAKRAEWQPKTKRSQRTIFAPPRLLDLLARMRELAPARDTHVFGGTKAPGERTGDRWARDALDFAGLPEFTFHHGRHSAITNALAAGIPLPEVVAQAGVSAKTLLTTYAHVIASRRPQIARIYDRPENRPESTHACTTEASELLAKAAAGGPSPESDPLDGNS